MQVSNKKIFFYKKGIHFSIENNNEKTIINYTLYYKTKPHSFKFHLEEYNSAYILQKSVDESIIELYLNKKFEIKITKKNFPHRKIEWE